MIGKALQAKIEIWTDGTADAGDLGEVRAAVVAFVQSASFFGCEDEWHEFWLCAIVVDVVAVAVAVAVAVDVSGVGVMGSACDDGCDGRRGG